MSAFAARLTRHPIAVDAGAASDAIRAFADLPPDLRPFREAFLFALVILALLLRPNGLFPARGLKERI